MHWISRAIGWLGDYQAVAAVVQSEFARIYLWPSVFAVMTGGAGLWRQVPAMWILMASAVSFASISHGMLRLSEYRERKDPLNKFKYVGTHAAIGIQVASDKSMLVNAIQVQIETRNDASFPISAILMSAETEIEGRTPPRTKYPKAASLVGPGAAMRHVDEPIYLGGCLVARLAGRCTLC